MVKYEITQAKRFSVLGDPTRFDILTHLVVSGAQKAGDIADRYEMSFPAVSKHLKILAGVELIISTKEGRFRVYKSNADALAEMRSWVDKSALFWAHNLDSLVLHIESKHKK